MLARIGRFAARRRSLVLIAWVVLVAVGAGLGGGIFDRTVEVEDAPPGSESLLTQQRLDALDPEGEIVTAVIRGEDFFAPDLRDSATEAMTRLRSLPGVVDVSDAYTSGGAIGDDGRSSLVVVELDRTLDTAAARETASEVADVLHGIAAPEVLVGGQLRAEQAFAERATRDAALGEGIAILALVVLLTVALGSLRIALVPVIAALAAIAPTLLVLTAVASVVSVNDFAVNVVTILGLGLAVDYGLLIVLRLREERAADPDATTEALLERAVSGAGRAVVVSGIAVCVALAGVFLLGDPLLSGMALGGAIVAVFAVLAGLTLVPAALATMPRALPAPGVRTWARPWARTGAARSGLLERSTRLAQRRPVAVTVAATAVLLVLAAPLASLTLDASDIRSLPATAEERRAFDAATTGFTGLGIEPVTVVVDGPVTDPAVVDVLDRIAAAPEVADADLVTGLPVEVTAVRFTPSGDSATGAAARALVERARGLDAAVTVRVTGPAASLADTEQQVAARMPWAVGVVGLAAFGLLFALTRSVVIPVKALVLAALTVSATLGVLVAVFSWGWGASVLGIEAAGALDVTTPPLIALLALGLTMDYEVFLLARIAERWRARDRGLAPRLANARAVREGIARTGPAVTLAAAAICVVFLGFAAGELVAMKEIGVGMVVAVVIDVTVVRGLLLPAVMTLLGRANWWPGRRRRASAPPGASPTGDTDAPPREDAAVSRSHAAAVG